MTRLLPLLFLFALLSPSPAAAQSVRAGDITVHYSAMPTIALKADVARQYGITRSGHRALVNIAVRKGAPGADVAVRAQVAVRVANGSGQWQALFLREVNEGEAIYYLGEARMGDNETLNFQVEVSVPGRDEPIRTAFRQEFFAQ